MNVYQLKLVMHVIFRDDDKCGIEVNNSLPVGSVMFHPCRRKKGWSCTIVWKTEYVSLCISVTIFTFLPSKFLPDVWCISRYVTILNYRYTCVFEKKNQTNVHVHIISKYHLFPRQLEIERVRFYNIYWNERVC